jgi:hypothetical protein
MGGARIHEGQAIPLADQVTGGQPVAVQAGIDAMDAISKVLGRNAHVYFAGYVDKGM